ncbi:MAG: hypothetical protein M3Q44_06615 [bacterium]|nr:hypothetical protein [bacterium]
MRKLNPHVVDFFVWAITAFLGFLALKAQTAYGYFPGTRYLWIGLFEPFIGAFCIALTILIIRATFIGRQS